MSNEITGKLILVLDKKSGTSEKGEWQTMDFVIETNEKYPSKVCLQAWNKTVDAVMNTTLGSELKISYNIESREYNSKWYTTLRVWKYYITSANSNHAPINETVPETIREASGLVDDNSCDDLPF